MGIEDKEFRNLKKLGRVDEKVYRTNVYKITKGDEVFEGTTEEVIKYLNTTAHIFNSTLWRCRKKNKPLKFKGYIMENTQCCIGEKVYAVVSESGEEILRGSIRKLAAEYGYKMGTLRNYVSNHKPIILKRKKYNLVPTGEYDIIWKRVH